LNAPLPRPSSTVALVRDARDAREGSGIEVLMLERATSNDHTSGAWVFPGGVIEAQDRLAPPSHDLAEFRAAAIRECFEECGIRLAAPGELHYVGHWVTPRARTKRFDTRFFVAVAPEGQDAKPDGFEILRHAWMTPREALSGDFGARLMTPTHATLQALAAFRTTHDAIAWARTLEAVPRIEPWLAQSASGLRSIPPGHPAYDELCKLDAEGLGSAWCELRPDVRVKIGERVARITDASGENRYLVGSDASGWEEVSLDAPRLIERERIVIARDASQLTPALRAAADWLAPQRGFLVDLRR
jgi:8-oxo-dGTP pyrophosphatase MutT (NUDIX family)